MVTGSGVRGRRRDGNRGRRRAQMILLGAITLAVIIVGTTVLVNSLTVTRTDVPSQASPQIDEAGTFGFEARKGSRSIVLRLNHRNRGVTPAELGALVGRNLTNYGQLLAETYVDSHGEFVGLTYHNDSSAFGRRIVQIADGNVTTWATSTHGGGNGNWYIGEYGTWRRIGWFTVNVNVENTSEARTFIEIENRTGHTVNVSINRTSTGSGSKLRVHSDVSSGGDVTATCEPSNGRVLLDLVDGTAFVGGCQFNGTAAIDPPYTVYVQNGKELVAKYELVYNESVPIATAADVYTKCWDSSSHRTDPCTAPAVWVANVTARFASSEINYTSRFNVSIYGGSS
ncbi:MAG: hypothetical protein ABEJ40_02810 [Haloarculaceae archaeon]